MTTPPRQERQQDVPRTAVITARDVYEAWAEAMRFQGRSIEGRESWDSLPEQDKRLDEWIAGTLNLIPWAAGQREAALDVELERLRSPRNSLGKLALPKGLMEYAVADAWDYEGVVTWVGDPEDGITQTSLSELADAIITALQARLATPPGATDDQ